MNKVDCMFDDGCIIEINFVNETDLDIQIIDIENKYNINFVECL